MRFTIETTDNIHNTHHPISFLHFQTNTVYYLKMNSTYSKLLLLVLQCSFLFGNISAYGSASYNDENAVFLEIYKKQCKGDTFMFDIDHAIVTCPHGSCTWGSQGLLKTQFTFGEVSPTAAPTGTPTTGKYQTMDCGTLFANISFWHSLYFQLYSSTNCKSYCQWDRLFYKFYRPRIELLV